MTLSDGTVLRKGDPIITFVNRNLEPYRGCHSFIRAIPYVQKLVPNAQIVLVGSLQGVSYGAVCSEGEWADKFLAEIDGSTTSLEFISLEPCPTNIFSRCCVCLLAMYNSLILCA